jgi:sugar lactone lactonase YvrE
VQKFIADVLFAPPTEELKFLPEGPTDLGNGHFSWIGIQHGAEAKFGSLNLFDVSSQTNRSIPLAGRPGFALPAERPGTFYIGLERRLVLFDVDTNSEDLLADGIDVNVDGTIVNDGVACRHGLIFGAKDTTFTTKKAGLYFWRSSDRKLFQLRSDQICSNGKVILAESDDHVDFLDIDTPTKKVVSYHLNVATGAASEPCTVLDLNELPFFPDGMVGTPDGRGVIISFYNPNEAPAGETRWYDLATHECKAVWETPGSPQATCPAIVTIGGVKKLVITTAVEHMPAERRSGAPHAGCLFVADTPF